MTQETPTSELREYLTVLWRRKLLVAIMIAATLGATVLYTNRQTRMYTSSAQVLVDPISLPVQGQSSYATVNMASEQLIATSPEVTSIAGRKLANTGITPDGVSVESALDQQTLTFTVTSPQPRWAKLQAQAYAEAYLEHRRQQLQQDLQYGYDAINSVIDDLNRQIADAEDELAQARAAGDDPRANVLELRISSLSSQLTTQQSSLNQLLLAGSAPVGQMVVPAYLPAAPSSPDVRRNVLLGLLLGLALGVGFAFLAERLDERVRRREEVEASTGAPLIARIPAASMPEHGVLILEDPGADASEAYRALRARVLYSASKLGARQIMVTSYQAGEGKTTTALNLAAALAQTDKRTVVVSGDMRGPNLGDFLGAEREPGLTDVLNGDAELLDALQPTSLENLSVLSSGRYVEDGSALLGSEAMRDLMTRLADHAEFVIVDAPPVVGVSDALSIGSFVPWVLFVADARRSKRSAIREAMFELRSVGASPLGVVLTRVPSREHVSYSSYANRSPVPDGDGQEPPARPVGKLLRLGRRN